MIYHFSPIDVIMYNSSPLCGAKEWHGITSSREMVTCVSCSRMLDELDKGDAELRGKSVGGRPFEWYLVSEAE